MNPILREALKTADGKMTPGLMSAVNDKRDDIMDRIAAVKGTTRQHLEELAHEIAEKTADVCDGTWGEAMDVAEEIWQREEYSGVNWCDVKRELERLYR